MVAYQLCEYRNNVASLDKKSVRDEFDKIKTQFQTLVNAGKVSSELAMLFNALILLFNIVLAVMLEKKTKKTSRNSGLPPSQTDKDTTQSSSKGSPTERARSTSVQQVENTRTVESIEVVPVTQCRQCNEDLSAMACQAKERRTRI